MTSRSTHPDSQLPKSSVPVSGATRHHTHREAKQPTVLIISYYFPPSGGPGVQRVLKFTRYLPDSGWRPVVLTVPEDAHFPARDETLMKDIPEAATIYRAPIVEFYDLYRKITGRAGSGAAVDIDTVQRADESMRERIIRAIRASVFIPDGRVGWMPGGLRTGRVAAEQTKPDVIFATGPPFTCHWLGAKLAAELERPLVLDFRDPWTQANYYPTRPDWARRIDERLERACLDRAARVVTVNERIRDDFVSRYPELRPERFAVIPNGFDPADFADIDRRPSPEWTIAHVGSIFTSRVPYGLLAVLEDWLRAEPELQSTMRFRLIGRICPEMAERVATGPLATITRVEGYVTHRESVQRMVDADLLLLLTNEHLDDPGMITGKVYEYLGSGTPVLALARPGELSRILERSGGGVAVAPQDRPAILEALRRARQQWQQALGTPRSMTSGAAVFSRPRQAAQLAQVLREVSLADAPGAALDPAASDRYSR